MRRPRLACFGLLLAIATVSCADSPPQDEAAPDDAATTETDVETLRALEETVVAAFLAGETEPLAALYPDDVVLLPPNQPALEGEDAVLAWIQGLYDQFAMEEFTSPVHEVRVDGDLGFSRGTFSWLLTPRAGGPSVADSGKFIVLWRRSPDGWKRSAVIWNSDNPPAGMN